jgi:hypothetical protein
MSVGVYWPQAQSTQVQFVQVQAGLAQLRAASPQLHSTHVHGSHVHAGFSQVVAVLMAGSPLSSADLGTTGNVGPHLAPWHASRRSYALTRSPPALIARFSPD